MVLYASDIMRESFKGIPEDSTIFEAANMMQSIGTGFLIVTRDNVPTGIVTEWDMVSKVMAKGADPVKTKVSEIMSHGFVSVQKDTPTDKLVSIMQENRIRRLPVMENGKVVGVITSRDIIRIFREYVENITEVVFKYGNR
ncbi:MAG: CBS domain-containing protein [Candidatus Thermoplasmatota archaeon]|jgi:signal-transduction protein with cAMP-binding, CBS, and nucleotidyltransferase domain|nr:CBS domain-containing protein [Candidatus Thermoplasmatota archaeon]MCL5793628.1 CBS domain-containing protein [Candidatus Thermoplasmatota archaeon]